jgi:hypothetical protein
MCLLKNRLVPWWFFAAAAVSCARGAGPESSPPNAPPVAPTASAPPLAPSRSAEALSDAQPPTAQQTAKASPAREPLTPELQKRLAGIRADPPPRGITRGRHYFVSNENQHHLVHQVAAHRGGIQIGVGTEQNYLLAGWAKPEILILMDFDEWVVDLNRVYGLLFERAQTPAELVALWSYAKRQQVLGWIKQRWPERRSHWKKVRAFNHGQADVHHRLQRLQRRHRSRGIPSFIDDQQQYDFVASLWRQGRVLSVRGDLTQDRTMQDIAEFARANAIPVRLLYLSNAEDYFKYQAGSFRSNMLALPYDERSVVLHTKPYDGDYYRYVYQSGLNYQTWLRSGKVDTWCDLFAYSAAVGGDDATKDLYRIAVSPQDAPVPRNVPCTRPD